MVNFGAAALPTRHTSHCDSAALGAIQKMVFAVNAAALGVLGCKKSVAVNRGIPADLAAVFTT